MDEPKPVPSEEEVARIAKAAGVKVEEVEQFLDCHMLWAIGHNPRAQLDAMTEERIRSVLPGYRETKGL